jgi:hypothetical protein
MTKHDNSCKNDTCKSYKNQCKNGKDVVILDDHDDHTKCKVDKCKLAWNNDYDHHNNDKHDWQNNIFEKVNKKLDKIQNRFGDFY